MSWRGWWEDRYVVVYRDRNEKRVRLIDAQADQLLIEQADERDKKRLEKTLAEKAYVFAHIMLFFLKKLYLTNLKFCLTMRRLLPC